MNALEIRNLTRRFGDRTAVDDLTLDVPVGGALALLGLNGAGKTTTLKLAAGLLPADSGSVSVMGHPAGSPQARAALGLSPQESAVAENLTVWENLEMMAGVRGMNSGEARRAAEAALDELGLRQVRAQRAKRLSGGWKRRLSIAMALIGQPDVLALDEPTLGLDVLARRELCERIRALRGKAALVLTTNDLSEAEQLADQIAVLSHGRLAALGTAAELTAQAGTERFEDAFVRLAGGADCGTDEGEKQK